MKAAGMKWLALNVGDGQHWADWQVVIDRARANDVQVYPWMRCRTLQDCWDLLDHADMVSTWGILNLEDELKDGVSPAAVAGLLDDFDVEVGISSVAWLYNDVDFSPLAELPMLLQVFAQDNRWEPAELERKQRDCVTHARDKGFTYVGVTFQTYGEAEPDWYVYHDGTRSYFTGDDIGAGQWEAWA